MGKSLGCEIQEVRSCLLSPEPQPDKVDRSTGTDQEAYEREVGRAQPAIGGPASPAPEKKSRDEVSKDRPEGILFAVIAHLYNSLLGEL